MKNNEVLLDVIGETDETLIPELSGKQKKSSIRKWSAIGGICAAAVIAFTVLLPFGRESAPIYGNLPNSAEREIREGSERINAAVVYGGMGFEGMLAYDISELDTPNPWNAEMELSALPVYRNLTYSSEYPSMNGMVYLTQEQMELIAQNAADALHVQIKSTEPTYVKDMIAGEYPEELLDGVWCLEADCSGGISISVYGDGEICVNFRNKKIPSGYSFTYDDTSSEAAAEVLSYLTKEFAELLQYEDPVCYSYADRTYAGEEIRSYHVYDRTGDPVQDILNFNLSYAQFAPDDYGSLMLIRLYNPFCSSEYLGDYPIITADEAEQLLLGGSYYSSVPEEYLKNGVIAEEDIAKTELVYRNNSNEEYYQPYYRFYVELDSSNFTGSPESLKDFGMFYVPAVSSEYLSDSNVNISFN